MTVSVEPATDAHLLAAIAAGDHRALEALYHRHGRWLLERLQRRCADSDMADTALQDTFVAVWRSAARYDPTAGEAAAWLWSIALRRLIDQLRRRKEPVPSASLPEPEPPPAPGTPAHALLSRLPGDLHAVTQAVYIDQLTTAEAAVLLGIPRGTVKSRLSRARTLLREELR